MTQLSIFSDGTVEIVSPEYYLGLSDHECNDPLDYQPIPYLSRARVTPVPEVRKFENGDSCPLTESWEWFWFNLFKMRNLTLTDVFIKNEWRRFTTGDRAFTNKFGSDTCRSFVLGTNTTKEPMKKEGVDCPGDNLYRKAGEPVNKNGRVCLPVWCLDYSYPPPTQTISSWLVHTARITHPPTQAFPKGYVTNFDYNFPVPLITGVGRQMVVDGFHCRENYMRMSRLKIAP